MADEKIEAAPEAMHSEAAGNTQAKRAAAKRKSAPKAEDLATKTSDAGLAGRVGEQQLASDPKPQPSPVPGSLARSVAPIDPITSRPEIMDGKVKLTNPDATPPAVLHPDYEPVRYLDSNGNEITDASELFEDVGMATKVRVTGRVTEELPGRNATTPHLRLLFAMGDEIDKSVAENFRSALKK